MFNEDFKHLPEFNRIEILLERLRFAIKHVEYIEKLIHEIQNDFHDAIVIEINDKKERDDIVM